MIICIDFDGTCVTHEFPAVGKEIGAAPVLRRLVENGHQLVLFTMRSRRRVGVSTEKLGWDNPEIIRLGTDTLQDAIDWFALHDLPLYGINANPTQTNWTDSPKAYGELYIDDAALGCPLLCDYEYSPRPFVNWPAVENQLKNMKLI